MKNIVDHVEQSLGIEPEPSGFAKIAEPWPDKEAEQEKHKEALKRSDEYGTFVLKQTAVLYFLLWALLGFVGARQGLAVAIWLSENVQKDLKAGRSLI